MMTPYLNDITTHAWCIEHARPAITDAIYAYRGSVNVKADGTFTPDGTLQPYSSAVPLRTTTWTVNYPAAQLTLEAGKLYTFTATLGADAHITLDAGAVNISDWSEGDQINIGR